MADPADIQRLVGDLARLGVVRSVDPANATARVAIGDLLTGDVPWLAARMGTTRIWSPPGVGEQVLVLCPEGDTAAGLILGSLSSDANPNPAADGSTLIEFGDGARILYDPDAHALDASLPAGATVLIAADTITLKANVRIEGQLDLVGMMTASDDVVAAGKSLKGHKHIAVQPGSGVSGAPQ